MTDIIPTPLTFLQKYHKDVIYVLIFVIGVFGTFFIKDKFHAAELKKQNEVIASLNTQNGILSSKYDEKSKAADTAIASLADEHSKLIAALSKKPIVITVPGAPLPQLPTIPTLTNLDDCNKTVQQLQVDNNDCITTVNALQEGKVASDALVANQKTIIVDVQKENVEVKKDVVTQTERKKLWRDSAILSTAILILKFLL
jgi:hypothetical protein